MFYPLPKLPNCPIPVVYGDRSRDEVKYTPWQIYTFDQSEWVIYREILECSLPILIQVHGACDSRLQAIREAKQLNKRNKKGTKK